MQAHRKTESHADPASAAPAESAVQGVVPPFPKADPSAAYAIPSPAHALQERLETAFAEPVIENRWSPRQTLAFLIFTCGAFWGAMVGGAIHLFG
ncbi:hypothetical protein [Oceanicaulis sp.]|jgi:hypothetical protein|uniref:hypothetical protein n=1 Tax=Oceanicaulis sp. TaxID=1924941 RepID=UPI000D31D25C